MRKLLTGLFILLGCCRMANAANTVLVSSTDGKPGDVVTVVVSLSATDRIVAAEFRFPITEGYSYQDSSLNVLHAGMSTSSVYVDNELRVYFYSADLENASLDDGDLFSFNVQLGHLPGKFLINPSVVLSDLSGAPLNVRVEGADVTVLAPQIEISASKINFGHVAIRSTYSSSIDITNTGTTPLKVLSITCSTQELSTSEQVFNIPQGTTKEITINYSPSVAGQREMSLQIESDATDHTTDTVFVVADTYSVNELTISSSSGDWDSDVMVDMYLDNMADIKALQCSFEFPEGITYVENSFTPSERMINMTSFPVVENGLLKIYVYSDSEELITEGSGKVASFKLHLGASNGEYGLVPKDVILCDNDYHNVLSNTNNGSVTVNSPLMEYISGVDFGAISLAGVSTSSLSIQNPGNNDLIIDTISFADSAFSFNGAYPIIVKAGDCQKIEIGFKPDSPGEFNSEMLLSTNLPNNSLVTIGIEGVVFNPNYITSEITIGADKSGSMIVSLFNYGKVTAVEMNVYGLEESSVDLSSLWLSERCADFSSSISLNDDGSVKILIYSLSNTSVMGDSGVLFSFNFSGDMLPGNNQEVRIADIILSDEKGNDISFSHEIINNAVISSVHYIVDEPDDNMYDLTGKRLSNDVHSLSPGVYIQNGRKFIIK